MEFVKGFSDFYNSAGMGFAAAYLLMVAGFIAAGFGLYKIFGPKEKSQ